MRRRILLLLSASVAALLFAATPAYASSVHLKGGANAEPAYTDNGLTLAAAAELAGLGNGDVQVTLTATADPVATCQNPGGGEHFPPGHNPAPVQVTGSVGIPAAEIRNGNTPFAVETIAPDVTVPDAIDCPGSSWTETITDLQFTAATVTVEQPPGTVVLTVECTIDPPSADGAIDRHDVICA